MKKLILAIVMMASSILVVGGATTAPANAAGCTYLYSSAYQDEYLPSSTAVVRNYFSLYWYDCGSYVEFDKYVVRLKFVQSGSCGDIKGWYVNPDIIAGYNPAEKFVGCNSSTTMPTLTWAPLTNYRGYKWDLNSNLCIGAKTTENRLYHDDPVGSYSQLCMTWQ